MKKIAIIAYKECWAMSVHAVKDFFSIISLLEKHMKRKTSYQASILSCSGENVCSASGSSITVDNKINVNTPYDLIIIPPIKGSKISPTTPEHVQISSWLSQHITNNTTILALTTGSTFLAATGLLDHVLMATHWAFARHQHNVFPNGQFTACSAYMQSENIYTTGTFNATFDVLLAILARDKGDQFAQLCSTHLLVNDPSELIPSLVGYRHHKDTIIFDVQTYIEQHYNQPLTLLHLAQTFNFSERNLKRRFSLATGISVIQYVQKVRIDKAKKLLITSNRSIKEISYLVGYESSNFFTRVFKKETDKTPSQWKHNISDPLTT